MPDFLMVCGCAMGSDWAAFGGYGAMARVDDRRVLSGMSMLDDGGRWADCPVRSRPDLLIMVRWAERGIWADIQLAGGWR